MGYDAEQISSFPTQPGVYLMRNRARRVIYVGKARNLKQRVKQYFLKGGDQRHSVPYLIKQVASIDTIVVSSEKEALILENTLIKQHQPKYNVLLKDDKNYIAVTIDQRQRWPMVKMIRYRGHPKPGPRYFGPYTSASAARETVDLTNRLFPLRQCSDQEFARRTRPCILYGMKRCLAPCMGYCSQEEYEAHVAQTVQFLKGQDKKVLKSLYQQMEAYSADLEFEQAAATLKTIRQVEKTVEAQHVDVVLGGDCDAFGLYREGGEVTLSQLLFRKGRLVGALHHHFSNVAQDDDALLESFMMQHYPLAEKLPRELLVPTALPHAKDLAEELADRPLRIFKPQRGEKVLLMHMAAQNAEAAFKKEKDAQEMAEALLSDMQERLRLANYPSRIECFDNSNIAGTDPVAAMVVFIDGKKQNRYYRTFKIKRADPSDDYGAMREVLERRYKRGKKEGDLPDLIIVDGGKGQLNIARQVLEELDIINIDLIAVTKEAGRHDKGMTAERVFLPHVKDPVRFRRNSSTLFFLQRIRDEAHRVAIHFHRKRRSKTTVASALDGIRGVGPAKKRALLRHFGSVKAIKEATSAELEATSGISVKDARVIFSHFHR